MTEWPRYQDGTPIPLAHLQPEEIVNLTTKDTPHMSFVYDKSIIDTDHAGRLKISVTVVNADSDESMQINIESSRIKLTHFISLENATKLAGLLVNAVAAYDRAVERAETAG